MRKELYNQDHKSKMIGDNKVNDEQTNDWATMMTSSSGKIFRVTVPLWGECTGYRRISITKASDAELWFLPRSP